MTKLQKGFTLIELLVVIAIIGILAGILFVSIDPSAKIKEAKVATAESFLAGIPALATIIYTSDGTDTPDTNPDYEYDEVCDHSTITAATDYTCTDSTTEWVVYIQNPGTATDVVCIDSTGAGVEKFTATAAQRTAIETNVQCN